MHKSAFKMFKFFRIKHLVSLGVGVDEWFNKEWVKGKIVEDQRELD